jgi:transposase
MSKDLLKALQELIVPVSAGCDIIDFKVEDKKEEVHIHLSYGANTYKEAGKKYSIYDYRPSRKWRHLDLWQYKTYIHAEIPRIILDDGSVKSISIPWSEEHSRITDWFEKKL